MITENKCCCDEHECLVQDDYTLEGYMCDECFMDCVIIDEMEN